MFLSPLKLNIPSLYPQNMWFTKTYRIIIRLIEFVEIGGAYDFYKPDVSRKISGGRCFK